VAFGAMAVLTGATLLRSWPGPDANLWVGTILIGAAIAVGNVAVPVFVKRAFPTRAALVTAIYVAVLGTCAGLAAAFAVPIAEASTLGWRAALAVWAFLSVLALVFWSAQAFRPSLTGGRSVPLSPARVNLWRSPVAWQLAAYMGLQSTVFYVAITWLPTVEQFLGYSAVVAGWHMFVFQVGGGVGNLLAPLFMRIGADERFALISPGVLAATAFTGLYFAPGGAVVWVAIIGLGSGVSFVTALSLMATRATSLKVAGQLSSMTQGVGYALCAVILLGAGALASTHTRAVVVVMIGASIAVAVTGLLAGRRRMVDA